MANGAARRFQAAFDEEERLVVDERVYLTGKSDEPVDPFWAASRGEALRDLRAYFERLLSMGGTSEDARMQKFVRIITAELAKEPK